jgi:hypothetical protein
LEATVFTQKCNLDEPEKYHIWEILPPLNTFIGMPFVFRLSSINVNINTMVRSLNLYIFFFLLLRLCISCRGGTRLILLFFVGIQEITTKVGILPWHPYGRRSLSAYLSKCHHQHWLPNGEIWPHDIPYRGVEGRTSTCQKSCVINY